MKKYQDLIKSYTRCLTENELGWLYTRLHDRIAGDLSEAVLFMSKHVHMDRWLSTASTANEFYDMIDLIQQVIEHDNRLFASSK